MSLSADSNRWSGFDCKPFDWDLSPDSALLSHNFNGFSPARTSLLSDKMKLKTGSSSLVDSGFYDHFDSIFNDLTYSSSRRRRYDVQREATSAASQSTDRGGKEYVIPIKVERVMSESPAPRTTRKVFERNCEPTKANSTLISRLPPSNGNDRCIEIPIEREPSKSNSGTDLGGCFTIPSHFTLLTPNIGQNRSCSDDPTRLKKGTVPLRNTPDKEHSLFRGTDNNKHAFRQPCENEESVIYEEEERSYNSLTRRPLRPLGNGVPSLAEPVQTRCTNAHPQGSDENRTLLSRVKPASASLHPITSVKSDANIADDVVVTRVDDVRRKEEAPTSENEVTVHPTQKSSRKSWDCCSTGVELSVTPTPSYPIYAHLKRKLASIDRRLDYIRGDGNCFFRALAKEVYNSEEFHKEWREAVVDVIEHHPNAFHQYIDDGKVAEHAREMRKLGTWATTCEIYAAATLLNREIYILAPNHSGSEYQWLLFSPRSLDTGTSASSSASTATLSEQREGRHHPSQGHSVQVHPCYLTLCHTNGNHYDRIVPAFARCNCELPAPCLDGLTVFLDLTDRERE